ncbi:peptidase S41, partial [Paenibacillus darwinianus]
MLFRGRTVAVFVLIAVMGSVLVTLTVADRLLAVPKLRGLAGSTEKATVEGGLGAKEIDKLNAVFRLVEGGFYRELTRDEMIDGAITGIVSALQDPYSVYMDREEARNLSQSIEGSFTGIGAELTVKDGKIVVISAMKDSPAERAGLRAQDVLLTVNGDSLAGLDLATAVSMIRGPKGTKAKLTVQRKGINQPMQLILVRDDIDLETVYAEMLPGNIGKIEIRMFSLNTPDRFREELATLEAQGLQALLIDVRDNPGGVLPAAVSIAQTFIERGKPIVLKEDKTGNRQQTLSKGEAKPYPLGVLINKGSASASEVLAASLKESAGAFLIGETSFGKGTVQISDYEATGDGSLVKMTVAKWLTPSGTWVQDKGIVPDVAVAQPEYFSVARISKTDTLVRDMVDEDVRSMQVMLDALGYIPGRKDGYFSSGTEAAVRAFQTEAGLSATGRVDVKTAEKLEERVGERIMDTANDAQLGEAVKRLKARIAGAAGMAGGRQK